MSEVGERFPSHACETENVLFLILLVMIALLAITGYSLRTYVENGVMMAKSQAEEWQPPAVVKITTQMTLEHRKMIDELAHETGKPPWQLIRDALDQTYLGREVTTPET